MTRRILLLSACLLLATTYLAVRTEAEVVAPREGLAGFPLEIESWTGQELQPFEPEGAEVLGADEYLNRTYASESRAWVGFYLGYYASQRQGDKIHSPLNCLPGAGWQPVSNRDVTIPLSSSQSITVNRYVVQQGLERNIVLYWYQSHGRVVANEYRSRLYLFYDAMRLNRTDAALVRVVAPIRGSGPDAEVEADHQAADFVKAIFPLLERFLPS
jgi:EpsI family protein